MAALKVFRGAFPVRAGHCKPDEVVVLVDQFNAVADKCDALVSERDAAVKERDLDLAEMRRFQGDKIRDTHEIATLRAALTASREREGKLREALTLAADTLADAARTFRIFGKPVAAEAMTIAEQETRAFITPTPAGTENNL